jgi:uncharacterized protein (TIGR03032 family)
MPAADFQLYELRHYEAVPSPGFAAWLAEQRISLACTVSAARVMTIGLDLRGQLTVEESVFERCLGLTVASDQTLYLATRFQIWRLQNALPAQQLSRTGHDRLYLPQSAYTTGNLLIHDLAVEAGGRVIFASVLFNCLATVDEAKNFVPLWKPPFITDITAGVRCRMTGLALRDGRPAYVTCSSTGHEVDHWLKQRADGGVVLDVLSGDVIARGLCMPNSPRWYRDQLWIAHSGAGEFGRIDVNTGAYEAVALAPGIVRGLCLSGDYAIVGVSRPRAENVYAGLSVEDRLTRQALAPRCGLLVIDLRTGQIAHQLYLLGKPIQEVFDVVALPGVRQPAVIDFNADTIQDTVTVGPSQSL